MPELDVSLLVLLIAGSALAGFFDAIVGGGGFVLVPLLFSALPAVHPATLFGTNKFASITGTSSAAFRYLRRVRIPWDIVLPATAAAFIGAFGGAAAVSWLPKDVIRPVVLVALVAVAVYTLRKPHLGTAGGGQARRDGSAAAVLVGALIGFYDGFLGPGTGTFLMFAFVRLFAVDFLRASAAAKVVNVATNLAALITFGVQGHILFGLAVALALANLAGAQVGSHLALRQGASFVRKAFLAVVALLIAKFGWDTLQAL